MTVGTDDYYTKKLDYWVKISNHQMLEWVSNGTSTNPLVEAAEFGLKHLNSILSFQVYNNGNQQDQQGTRIGFREPYHKSLFELKFIKPRDAIKEE
jgi:hypothetical protein